MLWWWFDTFEDDVDVADGSSGMWLKTVFSQEKKIQLWAWNNERFLKKTEKNFLRDRLVIGPKESRNRDDTDNENKIMLRIVAWW